MKQLAEKKKKVPRVSSKKATHKTTKRKEKSTEVKTEAQVMREFLFPHATD